MTDPAPASLANLDLAPRGPVHPSPVTWRDQILYFLLPDRFSDGQDTQRPPYDPENPRRAPDRRAWMEAGNRFQGGTLNGVRGRLDYLRELGITALWLGPVWRQRPDMETYHGYAIQDFLDVDPRFGTSQDLRDLVDAAHERQMYVLLDVIYNHTGDNWFYDDAGAPVSELPYRFQPPHPVYGWRSGTGQSIPAIGSRDDGVWPVEFQRMGRYTRAGRIGRWDPEPWEQPLHPDNEFRRGDFYALKDLALDRGDTLSAVIDVYKYWIALSDCDGFRIDTVKHVSWEASRNFCGAVREYAESIGKGNFLLLGEVTGGAAMERDYLDVFGRNIDAVLDIGEPARLLAGTVKGFVAPNAFFDQFHGRHALGSHRETGRYHVSILDDHDMIGAPKRRFCAGNPNPEQVAHAVGTQLTTLGIPCVYYGTEQAFDGDEEPYDPGIGGDRYIRESMFGGTFGAFETEGCHFFDPQHPAYRRIAAVAALRNRRDQVGLALRRGRMYLREGDYEGGFRLPRAGELTAWSRLLHDREVLIALNTSGDRPQRATVTVHAPFHPDGSTMTVLYRGDWKEFPGPTGERAQVTWRDGRACVSIDLPPAGMTILA
ncbi:alpha-amylase family glycosyl hydrolase [Nonomuraea sp. NPDC050556]|uniref:alpha-amylase family glycosyl hydrolase n=1 Tax=Nonomuraea sp. NPDC050556 TaxID=3364369 RepID=UPI0037A51805